MRRARQPLEPVDRNATSSAAIRRTTATESAEDIPNMTDLVPSQHHETTILPVETSAPLATRHEIRHPTVQPRAPSLPSEVIVLSSDTEEDEPLSTRGVYGSTDTEAQLPYVGHTQEHPETASERALQQLFDRDHDFYESLYREMAQRGAQRATSEASFSSARMESMVPDASTTYDSSSWAPLRTTYSHGAYPVARLQHTLSPSMQPHQALCESPVPAQVNAPVVYDAYGNQLQPVYVASPPAQTATYYPGYILAPVTAKGSGVWHPNDAASFGPTYEPDHRPESHHFQRSQYQSIGQSQCYPQHQQTWHNTTPPSPFQHTPQQPSYDRAQLASYARPKTPHQALEDKAKADFVYKSLQEASKRARTSSSQVTPSSSHSKRKENEWSTLEASRARPDGTLTLTAALRRPLPATRLAHGSRGGSHLALPLYRPLGSSAEERQRAKTTLSDSSSRYQRAESSHNSIPQRMPGAPRSLKLFRPSAPTKRQ